MKKSFFEKSYLITLLLFLVLLNGGILTLALYTSHTNSEAAKQVCRAENFCIAEAFENDRSSLGDKDVSLLMVSYGSFYGAKNIGLCFASDGSAVYSTISEDYIFPEAGTLSVRKYNGKRILMISSSICDGEFTMTYSKDISYLDDELVSMISVFSLLSVFVSALLALLLYFVQRKLYLPLGKLRLVTREIAEGNLTSRAYDSGNDEFSELAKDFNSMADRISEQMDTLRESAEQRQQMLDNLAHEMRTPLTSIYGYAEYAFGVELEEEERMKALNAIMSETMRLKSISSVLLDLTFIRENGIELKDIHVSPLLKRVEERFNGISRDKNLKIVYTGGDFEVSANETLLEELVSNLTENSVKACSNDGLIEIGASDADGVKQIFVKDNGVGMTKEQLAHITEPFYRTDKSRNRKYGGTGLGLALCKRIADSHGALLIFTSEAGKGTTAFLRWESR